MNQFNPFKLKLISFYIVSIETREQVCRSRHVIMSKVFFCSNKEKKENLFEIQISAMILNQWVNLIQVYSFIRKLYNKKILIQSSND